MQRIETRVSAELPAAATPANRDVKPRRRGRPAALLGLLTVGTVVVAAAPAQAAYVGNNFLRNWQTGQCLTAYIDQNIGDLGVYAGGCEAQSTGNKYQTWEPEYLYTSSNDVVQLRSIQENMCIEAYYVGSGLYMNLEPCDSSNTYQQFLAEPGYSGSGWSQVRFESIAVPGQCIDNNSGEEVNFESCVYSDAYGEQLWKLGL